MKILFDTNIVLDVLMDREPFVEAAVELMTKVEAGSIRGYLCTTTVTTISYLLAKELGTQQAHAEIRKLMSLFEIAGINRPVLEAALVLPFADYEDAVLYESARHAGAEAIITRNGKDFRGAELPVYSSDEFVRMLGAG